MWMSYVVATATLVLLLVEFCYHFCRWTVDDRPEISRRRKTIHSCPMSTGQLLANSPRKSLPPSTNKCPWRWSGLAGTQVRANSAMCPGSWPLRPIRIGGSDLWTIKLPLCAVDWHLPVASPATISAWDDVEHDRARELSHRYRICVHRLGGDGVGNPHQNPTSQRKTH